MFPYLVADDDLFAQLVANLNKIPAGVRHDVIEGVGKSKMNMGGI